MEAALSKLIYRRLYCYLKKKPYLTWKTYFISMGTKRLNQLGASGPSWVRIDWILNVRGGETTGKQEMWGTALA